MARFIAAQRAEHGIPYAVACRALGVSQSWFYKWVRGDVSRRRERRRRLAAEIVRLFGAHRGRYGSPRITDDLIEAGWRVSKNTVAALMRELGLVARPRRRRPGTTRQGKGRWRAPDLVRRINSATVEKSACAVSQATCSSNQRVNRDLGRAHGTSATTTPCTGQSTRGVEPRKNTRITPMSSPRHTRSSLPLS